MTLPTIGKLEKVSFPELGWENLTAKIDTGAYTSALHCHRIKVIEKEGKPILCFHLLDPNHEQYEKKELQFSEFSKAIVKSSTGEKENRYKIKTKLKIGEKVIRAEFTLTDRSKMRYPVLIGRKVLKKRFLVDVSKKNLLQDVNR